MMRSLVQNRDQMFVKGCGFFSFAKNMGKDSENLSGKYNQRLLDNVKQSAIDAFKKRSS